MICSIMHEPSEQSITAVFCLQEQQNVLREDGTQQLGPLGMFFGLTAAAEQPAQTLTVSVSVSGEITHGDGEISQTTGRCCL